MLQRSLFCAGCCRQFQRTFASVVPARRFKPRFKNAANKIALTDEDPFSNIIPKRAWSPHSLKSKRKDKPVNIKGLFTAEIKALGQECAGLKTLANLIEEDFTALSSMAKEWSKKHLGTYTTPAGSRPFNDLKIVQPDLNILTQAHELEGAVGLRRIAYRNFLTWASTRLRSPTAVLSQKLRLLLQRTDFTYPMQQIIPGQSRSRPRKLIMHVGPTNSGKTHQALVALAKARVGIYAGPLRLLAHEVYSRFNAGKIGELNGTPRPCNLLTGEEQRKQDPNDALTSCTVEMLPVNRFYDVVVIDEIQMIADTGRGGAWTSALLYVNAKEVHLCGEESAVDIIRHIAQQCGDEIEIRRYSRLNPLEITPSINGDLRKIQPGDCVVTFSRNNIFAVKQAVEKATNLKVAVAYGGLPPEVREEQARLFNEANSIDVMVASDAIGMGLNLKIKRIIFEALHKWDGTSFRSLITPQVKQIAGRAGRFGMHVSPSAPDDMEEAAPVQKALPGQVTTLDAADMPLLQDAIASSTIHLKHAVMDTQEFHLARLSAVLSSKITYAQLLKVAHFLGHTSKGYFLPCENHQISTAYLLSDVTQSLTLDELATFAAAPVNNRDEDLKKIFTQFVKAHVASEAATVHSWASQEGCLDLIKSMLNYSQEHSKIQVDSKTLLQLESFHRALSLYLWLSYRFPLTFCKPGEARTLRRDCEKAIDVCLQLTRFERKKVPQARVVRSRLADHDDAPFEDGLKTHHSTSVSPEYAVPTPKRVAAAM